MIYEVDDGKGIREVYVNGKKIDRVIFADDVKGEVWFYPEPVRIIEGSDEIYKEKLTGKVRVKFK